MTDFIKKRKYDLYQLIISETLMNKSFKSLALGLCCSCCSVIVSAANTNNLQQLKGFSLEDLAEVEVSIAGKTLQKLVDIPAAVYVLTKEQIRYSSATNIPDLLRLVPGLHVAQIDANKWVVSSRGFSSRITNKLLVMIDGRSIYSPLFGGVMWDQQNIMIEDIERIEVVRGPGGTVWGANAVNGVINIISKHTRDTKGGLVSTIVGTERNIVSLRQGGELTPNTSYRIYAKHREQDKSISLDGPDANDSWRDTQAGFRIDWQVSKNKQFTLQGDIYQGDLSERIRVPSLATATFTDLLDDNIDTNGANLLAKWSQTNDDGSSNHLQVYIDHTEREQWIISEHRDIFDIDYQYSVEPLERHSLMFGLGYRYTEDKLPDGDINTGQVHFFTPDNKSDHLFNAFIQDDITLKESSLWLTLGSKIEHNQYTGLEFQPSIRLRWRPVDNQLVWASISKAVRTPTRAESDGLILFDILSAGPPPIALVLQGNTDLKSEQLVSYELGYRYQASNEFIFDASAFYQDYDNLVSFESTGLVSPAIPTPIVALSNTLDLDNLLEGTSYGVEISTVWFPNDQFSLMANYSYLKVEISPKHSSLDTMSESQEGLSPQHQFNVTSSYKIQDNLKVNLIGRYMGELSTSNTDAYTELDSNIQWQASKKLSLSLAARNLLNNAHSEAIPAVYPTAKTKVEREFFIKIDWLF